MRRLSRPSLPFAFVLVFSVAFSAAQAQELVEIPALTRQVTDLTGTLSAQDVQRLEAKLSQFETAKGSQIAVLILPSTKPEAIEQFGIRLAETWQIGRKKIDDGAILIVAKQDRSLRIETGYGIEGALPDAICKRIIDEQIVPRFKADDFAGGIEAGLDAMIARINGEDLPAPVRTPRGQSSGFEKKMSGWIGPGIVVLIILGNVLSTMFSRLTSGIVMGVLGFVAGLIIASLTVGAIMGVVAMFATWIFGGRSGGGSGWSGWSGGSSSGWSSGGSSWSSGGGSSWGGGGGSFGGGGSSGSW